MEVKDRRIRVKYYGHDAADRLKFLECGTENPITVDYDHVKGQSILNQLDCFNVRVLPGGMHIIEGKALA